MRNVKLLPTMGDKIAQIEAALRYDSPVTQWERDRLADWRDTWFGSKKQNEIVDRIYAKMFSPG